MIVAAFVTIVFVISILIFINQLSFGKKPKGERLERLKNSPHYKHGKFQNLSETPILLKEAHIFSILRDYGSSKRKAPKDRIPSKKTDLINLDPNADILVWFGHSSYFIQTDGKKILVDPVMSGAAGPISFFTKAFKGTDPYSTDDIPNIDYLFITHDHWDHLDYKTLRNLKPKITRIICPLGVGEHLERWGFEKNNILEKDWYEKIPLASGFTAYSTPARHFSGRDFVRNKTLWTSYVLQTPDLKIFLGGDSGYDSHFMAINKTYGAFDLAILENGQYNKNWRFIHMLPDEVLKAAMDLEAKRLFPVHSSKFALSLHAWDDPLKKITALNSEFKIPIITPMIGEQVNIKDNAQQFSKWWKKSINKY